MWRAAKATYPQAWEREMREMRKVDEEAYKHLMKIPPRYWSKSRFNCDTKCDVLVNNMSETFNSVIMGPRQKPIITMLEEIKDYLMDRWASNRTKIESYTSSVLPRIKKRLERQQEYSRFFMARLSGDQIYQVRHLSLSGDKFTVDLKKMECSCRSWMLTGIPCCHAIPCIQQRHQDPADYIPPIYRKEAYQDCYRPLIYPCNGENLWEETQYCDILPPPSRRAPGRPKRNRNKDADEKRSDSTTVSRKGLPNKCSICRKSGHNKSSCPNAPKQSQTHPEHTSNTPQTQNTPQETNQPLNAQSQPSGQSQTSPRIQTRQSAQSSQQSLPVTGAQVVTRYRRNKQQRPTTAFQPPRQKLTAKRKLN